MARRTSAAVAFLFLLLIFIWPSSLVGQAIGPREVDALPSSVPTLVQKYGAGELQFGELRMPPGKGPFPVAVVIHGGCWTRGFATLRNTAPISSDLTKNGIATWNIEYRQVGDEGGGWPGTFRDWGDGVDYLRTLAKKYPIDLSKVVVVGHSAGAHAALWIAARHKLPADSEIRGSDPLKVLAAVAIDGPGELNSYVGLDAQICGKPVIVPLMGGTPEEKPEQYRQASPQSQLPLGVPQFLVSAEVLTTRKAKTYEKLAMAAGDHVEVLDLRATHFEIIAPGQEEWDTIRKLILDRAFKSKPSEK